MERFAEDAAIAALREYLNARVVESKVVEGKQDAGEKFADYFDYSEPSATSLAPRAGLVSRRREEMLTVALASIPKKPEWDAPHNPCEGRIAARFGVSNKGRPADKWLADTVRWTWRVKVFMHLATN